MRGKEEEEGTKLTLLARINAGLLQSFKGQTVRLTAKVIKLTGETATVEASDGGQVGSSLPRPLSLPPPLRRRPPPLFSFHLPTPRRRRRRRPLGLQPRL